MENATAVPSAAPVNPVASEPDPLRNEALEVRRLAYLVGKKILNVIEDRLIADGVKNPTDLEHLSSAARHWTYA